MKKGKRAIARVPVLAPRGVGSIFREQEVARPVAVGYMAGSLGIGVDPAWKARLWPATVQCHAVLFLSQGPEHPSPGKPFTARGFPRQCYLPDSPQGRKVSPHPHTAYAETGPEQQLQGGEPGSMLGQHGEVPQERLGTPPHLGPQQALRFEEEAFRTIE